MTRKPPDDRADEPSPLPRRTLPLDQLDQPPGEAHSGPSPLDIPARRALRSQRPGRRRPAPHAAPPRVRWPCCPPRPLSQHLRLVHTSRRRRSRPGSADAQAAIPQAATVRVTGAQALVLALEQVGVEVVFGIPGGAMLPAYDPLLDSERIRHILVRHEQGAGHAADRVRAGHRPRRRVHGDQRPGRDQPGHPDRGRLHGLRRRGRDHRPGAQQPRSAPTGSRRRTSPASRCRSPSTTSWSPSPKTSPRTIAEAFHLAGTGRPGPVLVDIAKDAMQAMTDFTWPVAARPARLPPGDPAALPAGARGRPDDHRREAAGAVRRRRRDQGRRGGRAAARWPSSPASRSSPR